MTLRKRAVFGPEDKKTTSGPCEPLHAAFTVVAFNFTLFFARVQAQRRGCVNFSRIAPKHMPCQPMHLPGATAKATLGPWRMCFKGAQILMLRLGNSPGAKFARETGT